MSIQIRPVSEADIATITAIYAAEVRELVNTYEYEAPDQAEMTRRMQDITARGFPYIVAEVDGQVAGYAYANSYRGRIAYQWTVENSVYVASRFQGCGVGSTLLAALIEQCTERGFRQMIAVIGEAANTASVALHQRFGFTHVGTFRGIGRKHGRWLDTVQMQRALGDGADSAPEK